MFFLSPLYIDMKFPSSNTPLPKASLKFEPGLHDERLATNCLSHCTEWFWFRLPFNNMTSHKILKNLSPNSTVERRK